MNVVADYAARRIAEPIEIDGNIDKPVWRNATWSRRFVDMASGAPGLFDTRTALLWTDTHLYIAFWAEDPMVEARLLERDSLIFQENDLEVFIDGGDCYYELEVNAANTIYEVFFVWRDAYKRGGKFDQPQFDIQDSRTYSFAGNDDRSEASFWRGTHPRGARWAFTGFDLPGLRTAVNVDGTLNDNSDIDRGWSLEISIPWTSLSMLAGERALPPASGDIWRMFLGRFQKLMLGGNEIHPHPAMVLNSHGVYDTHLPERWSKIRFEV
jgi:hypothetical protein